jgi:hypothetical protein
MFLNLYFSLPIKTQPKGEAWKGLAVDNADVVMIPLQYYKKGNKMEKRKTIRKIGLYFVLGGIAAFALEKLSDTRISSSIARVFCGGKYLLTTGGKLSGSACGFNADIVFVLFCFAALFFGFILMMIGRRKKKSKKTT